MRAPDEAVSADALMAALRAHADRVHDLVRRLGCGPAASPGVVEASALDVVSSAQDPPGAVPVLLGRWFALAAARAVDRPADVGPAPPPVGRGVLADDAQQELLARGLSRCDQVSRTALLLSDAYSLPPDTVAAGLGTDPDAALRLVGRARLGLLPDVYDSAVPSLGSHAVDEGALARIAGGSTTDAGTARHARGCSRCGPVLRAQEDVRRLLAGLSVVALPDEEREALLARVTLRARAVLPSAAALSEAADELAGEPPRRLLSPLPVLLAVLLAVVLGVGVGILADRPGKVAAAPVGFLPPVTAPPLPALPTPDPLATSAAPAGALPSTTVFTISPPPPPRTTPPATRAPTSTPPPVAPEPTVLVDPARGPAGSALEVTGAGWKPGARVTLAFLDAQRQVLSTTTVVVDAAGQISGRLTSGPAGTPPGRYRVRASDDTRSVGAPYEIV